jgi:SOS-response transcriptional repressor LexA
VDDAEARLRDMIERAGFPQPRWHERIVLGRALGDTYPDCFFPGEDAADPGTCLYLDGLSAHIHGNPTTQAHDRALREALRSRGFAVFEIAASELDDQPAMTRHFYRLAQVLMGKDRAREVRDRTDWFGAVEVEVAAPAPPSLGKILPFRRVKGEPRERYKTAVPLLSLKAAAGGFDASQAVEHEDWVEPGGTRKLREGMFVAQVVGKSMEPKIPDGAWCLFVGPVTGTRRGRIVLVEHRQIHDPDTGGSYTVKRYQSEKVAHKEGGWRHSVVRLVPINPDYAPIVLDDIPEEEIKVVAELVEVLSPPSDAPSD